MRKILFFFLLFIIFVIIGMAIVNWNQKSNFIKNYPNLSVMSYTIQNKTYKLLVADTQAKWEKGLMFYRVLNEVDGMIFLFPDSAPRTFWNQNTLMDLKLLWINNDKVIGQSDLPSIEKSQQIVTVSSPGPANKVIELPIK